jgi:hypothetical protein
MINKDTLESIFITALEGGSNYWYILSDAATKIVRSHVPKEVDPYLSTSIVKAIMDHNAIIPINDAEHPDEILGWLSQDRIDEMLNKLMSDESYVWALKNEISEQGDAESSDIIFQYLVIGGVEFS